MMRRFHFVASVAISLLAGCANYDPGSVQMSAGSNQAVLLLEVDPIGGADYYLDIDLYDEENLALASDSFTGHANFYVKPGAHYLAQTVSPGTYAVTMVTQQLYWTACMHANSVAFDVKPGEVVYLGRFNPAPQLRYIQDQARLRGELLASSSARHWYFDAVPPLVFEVGGDREKRRTETEVYVRAQMPKVVGPVRIAEFRPVRFGTGYSLLGERICTGIFRKSIKR